ncbi:MAG TPA: S8 family serine peptidase, partial [Longimicrobiaceae bacterium]|nr:S8 family serine peptidase [Longimicrobiaceae bacterium]
VRPIATAGNTFLLEGEPTPDYGLLDAANALAARDDVEYAEPNAVVTSMLYVVNPPDFLVPQQWHIPLVNLPDAWQTLRDTNAGGVVLGAAGDRTYGHEDIQIVVFDQGVQSATVAGVTTAAHPDFQGNVTSGAAKVAAFYDAVNMAANNDLLGGDHGMGCAGVAAARAENPSSVAGEWEGVAGAAGNCRIVAVRAPFGAPTLRWADAFVWMAGFDPGWVADGVTYPIGATFPPLLAQGVDIHTNSVRIPDVGLMDDALDFLATYGRGGRGMVSFLAAGNTAAPISHPSNNTIADHEKVITVAASINTDVRSGYSCFDPAIDICAPSSGDVAQTTAGAPGKVTTDTTGGGNLAGHTGGGLDYRGNFGGTSSATPLAAGIGALMLSINPDLNWVQVREVLRNTAIKIDTANTDPVGQWTVVAGSPVFSQWYGYGRVDADLAVVGALDHALASDVVIRDNLGDTGAVPSGGWHADSPDIWVRRTDDPIPVLAYGSAPWMHENPVRGQDNFVYLRVKNVGTAPTNEVYLRALICHFPGFEFRYPDEWQPSTPPSSPVPSPLVPGSYLIGEVMIDDLGPLAELIVKMRWDQDLVPPDTVTVSGMPVQWHPCLLAEVSPHDGPGPSPGTHDVKRYNDLAHKNITVVDSGFSGGFSTVGVVAGTSRRAGVRSLVIDRAGLAPGARVFLRVDDREAMQHWLKLAGGRSVRAAAALPWRKRAEPRPDDGAQFVELQDDPIGRLTFVDAARAVVDLGRGDRLLIDARPGTGVWRLRASGGEKSPQLSAGRVRGQDVVFFDGGGADSLELPLDLRGGEYVALAMGVEHPDGGRAGTLRATQRLADGELSPGYELRL